MWGAQEVVPGVYQLWAVASAVFVILGERVTIVDAGGLGSAGLVLRFLERLGRRPGEVGHIVVTHHHLDHTGSLARLKEATGAAVAAHRKEVPFLTGPMPNPFVHPALAALTRPIVQRLEPRRVEVDVPLEDGQALDSLAGFQVLHTPGHTPGSLSLYAPERGLLLVGDALQTRWGWVRGPAWAFTVDPEAARDTILRLSRLPVRVLCSSHSPPFTDRPAERLQRLAVRTAAAI